MRTSDEATRTFRAHWASNTQPRRICMPRKARPLTPSLCRRRPALGVRPLPPGARLASAVAAAASTVLARHGGSCGAKTDLLPITSLAAPAGVLHRTVIADCRRMRGLTTLLCGAADTDGLYVVATSLLSSLATRRSTAAVPA